MDLKKKISNRHELSSVEILKFLSHQTSPNKVQKIEFSVTLQIYL